MAYADRDALSAVLPSRGGESAFLPLTQPQVDGILDGIADDLNAVVAVHDHAVPVSAAAYPALYALLVRLNVWGAAAEVQRARYQDGGGPNSEAAWEFFEKRYQDGKATLMAMVSGMVGRPSSLRPASYTTLHPTEDGDLGANAQPRVSHATLEW